MKNTRSLMLLALALVPAVFVTPSIARLRPDDVLPLLARTPGAVANLPISAMAEAASSGRHLGFDTYSYPGDAAMLAWRAAGVPYEWVGYYLPAPCHRDASWSGKRERLTRMGWGLAVIYVGQQTWDGVHAPSRRARAATGREGGVSCDRSLLNASYGAREADDAIARTAAEGFAPGTVIFLDIEYMDLTPQRMRDYYSAWVERVLEDGRYRPGIYAHTRNAERIYTDVAGLYAAFGIAEEPAFWIASGRNFAPTKAPHEVGHTFAHVWQGVLDVVQTWNGVSLPIDVNVAATPSPSAREYALVFSRPSRSGLGGD